MGQEFESLQARHFYMVVVAQLVRVPGCGPGGRGFDSHQPPQGRTQYGAKLFGALRIFFKINNGV